MRRKGGKEGEKGRERREGRKRKEEKEGRKGDGKKKTKNDNNFSSTLICQQSHSGSTIPSITVTVLGRDNFPSTVVLTRCSTPHKNPQLKHPL